jgi:transcriptional regulator with XRE-family HTH domain
MAASSFSRRFREVIKGLTDAELGAILGVTSDAARKMRTGRIKSLKLEAALRLARELKVSPWYLAGEPEPATRLAARSPSDRHRHRQAEKARSDRAQLETAESALLLHDEVVELRSRVRRLEAAVEGLQSRARASSEP